jgi:hypothetical protein
MRADRERWYESIMRHGLFFAAVLVASVAATTVAGAAEPSPQDIAQARELAIQAQEAFEAGRYEESEKLWIAASALYPQAPTLTLGLARTQAKLGKLVLSQESYKKIIREHENAPNLTPAFKDAVDAAKNEVTSVSARIANVIITVEGAPNPVVTLDGQPVVTAALGLKRPVDPGSHVVKAEAEGFKPAETKFEVAESGLAEAKLKLEKLVAEPVGPAPNAEAPPPPPPEAKRDRTLAYVAFGVGGAGLVFGAVTGALALGKHGDLADKCPNDRCPNALGDEVDSFRTMGTLSTIGFIVAGAGIAAGTVLWITAPKKEPAPGAARSASYVSVRPYLSLGGGGVAGTF